VSGKQIILDDSGKVKDEKVCEDCGGEPRGVFCAICDGWYKHDSDEVDFHHWDYEKHIGVLVCRDCHESIHRTECSYPDKNDDWLPHAIRNAIKSLKQESEGELEPERIRNRLNISEGLEVDS